MAIEDAVVLADQVASHDFAEAFLAYQRERMNRTARVVLSSRVFGEVLHADGGARELRNEYCRARNPDECPEVDWLYKGV
jgi:3-hydroxybenzoate 6-monooxygenase